jgi:hypothetical protein
MIFGRGEVDDDKDSQDCDDDIVAPPLTDT